MIAFCLDRLGLDPAFLIGGEIPQLGGNARAGAGWLVVEGDESDRSVAALRPEIAVLLNVDLDHHATFGTRAEVAALFEDWLAHVPHVVRAEELEPVELELAVPGEHNRRNAAAALAALELAGVARADAERVIVEFAGAGRRLERRGRGRRRRACSTATRTTRPSSPPTSPRCASRTAACSRSSSRTSTRGRCTSRTSSRVALAAADAVCVTEIYPAREEPLPGVTRPADRRRARARAARACASAGRRALDDAARARRLAGRGRATPCSRSAPATSTGPAPLLLEALA